MVNRSTVTWVRIVELCFDDVCVCPAYACICVFIYKWIVFVRTTQRRWMFRFVLFVVSVLIGKWPKVVVVSSGYLCAKTNISISDSIQWESFCSNLKSVILAEERCENWIWSNSSQVSQSLYSMHLCSHWLRLRRREKKENSTNCIFFFRVFKATYSCKSIFNA